MTTGGAQHWESVWAENAADDPSWFRPHLEQSLRFIEAAGLAPGAPIIDVGGGASTLVDDLLDRGYTSLTVLDISAAALAAARARLGGRAAGITWIHADATRAELPARAYAL